MEKNKPPFELDNEMINLIAEITEKIGRLEESGRIDNNLLLRRENRIKTIKSTTAIENNTLSLKQVSDIINGKVVLGNKDEIQEVKNAFTSYMNIAEYNPYDIKSFLKAHATITDALIQNAGKFRSGDVGVFDGEQVIHIGARPEFVPNLVKDLLKWAEKTDTHPLVVSAVVHYEIEYIHPFDDGNGRIGRLWQTLILYNWKKVFEHIPVETIVHKYQQDYYNAIEQSKRDGLDNRFILFMLKAINETLDDLEDIELTDIVPDIITEKLTPMEKTVLTAIVKYLLKHETIDNNKAQELSGKSAESIKKYLSKFAKINVLIPVGEKKGRKYKLNKDMP
jgi:Fic family protein